jgi:hypothetical protein
LPFPQNKAIRSRAAYPVLSGKRLFKGTFNISESQAPSFSADCGPPAHSQIKKYLSENSEIFKKGELYLSQVQARRGRNAGN